MTRERGLRGFKPAEADRRFASLSMWHMSVNTQYETVTTHYNK